MFFYSIRIFDYDVNINVEVKHSQKFTEEEFISMVEDAIFDAFVEKYEKQLSILSEYKKTKKEMDKHSEEILLKIFPTPIIRRVEEILCEKYSFVSPVPPVIEHTYYLKDIPLNYSKEDEIYYHGDDVERPELHKKIMEYVESKKCF